MFSRREFTRGQLALVHLCVFLSVPDAIAVKVVLFLSHAVFYYYCNVNVSNSLQLSLRNSFVLRARSDSAYTNGGLLRNFLCDSPAASQRHRITVHSDA